MKAPLGIVSFPGGVFLWPKQIVVYSGMIEREEDIKWQKDR